MKSLNFILTCLNSRKKKTKINSCFSVSLKIILGVPKSSILKLLLFIICICELFMEYDTTETDSFVDDPTLFTYRQSFDEMIE